MNPTEESKDQHLKNLIYIGNTASAFELHEVVSLTIEQYNKRKAELEGQKLPWIN